MKKPVLNVTLRDNNGVTVKEFGSTVECIKHCLDNKICNSGWVVKSLKENGSPMYVAPAVAAIEAVEAIGDQPAISAKEAKEEKVTTSKIYHGVRFSVLATPEQKAAYDAAMIEFKNGQTPEQKAAKDAEKQLKKDQKAADKKVKEDAKAAAKAVKDAAKLAKQEAKDAVKTDEAQVTIEVQESTKELTEEEKAAKADKLAEAKTALSDTNEETPKDPEEEPLF